MAEGYSAANMLLFERLALRYFFCYCINTSSSVPVKICLVAGVSQYSGYLPFVGGTLGDRLAPSSVFWRDKAVFDVGGFTYSFVPTAVFREQVSVSISRG